MTTIRWSEDGVVHDVSWHSENGAPAPSPVQVIGDDTTADDAYRLAGAGLGLLWRGDFHNGRQLVQAMDRRLKRDRGRTVRGRSGGRTGRRSGGRSGGRADRRGADGAQAFFAEREFIAERALLLGKVIVELGPDHSLDLRRAPETAAACHAAYGQPTGPVCVSLTELGGVLSAYQWQLRGVDVPALGGTIHPRYGVFSPVRGEYIDLVAQAPLPPGVGNDPVPVGVGDPAVLGEAVSGLPSVPTAAPPAGTAFDLGTGTGVLAALLLRRGVSRVVATDINPRAVACARENLDRLCPGSEAEVIEADLFPRGRSDLVVCNPPWLPARPSSALESGIYDPNSDVLHRFIDGLSSHLTPRGEGWLIISDLAERLGLRPAGGMLERIESAGLRVIDRLDTAPRHSRADDVADALHAARSAEVTSLWRLGPA